MSGIKGGLVGKNLHVLNKLIFLYRFLNNVLKWKNDFFFGFWLKNENYQINVIVDKKSGLLLLLIKNYLANLT